jgi:hypothetical protein
MTVPGRFNLLTTLEDGQTWTPEATLLAFLRSIQTLFQKPNSPYPLHSPLFSASTPLRRLLSPVPEPPIHFIIRLAARARMKATCRLAALLNVHIIYLHQSSPRDLSRHLLALSSRLLEHEMHRRGTVEFLASMMTVVEGETIAMNDHAWEVITMMSVAKSLHLDVLNKVGDLLFECLTTEMGSLSGSEASGNSESESTEKETIVLKFEKMRERVKNDLCGVAVVNF